MENGGCDLSDVTLAILAGGEGSRMGKAKGHLCIDGEPILCYLLKRFDWPGPTLLVTAPGRERPPGWEAFRAEACDAVAGEGPLRGIWTALEAATTEELLVTPVDMPGLTARQLRWLAREFRARRIESVAGRLPVGLMARHPGGAESRVEPFPAAFHREAGEVIAERLRAGRGSVSGLAEHPAFLTVAAPQSWDELSRANLNRPGDLEAFERRAKETPL